VSTGDRLTTWQRWIRQPQKVWLRRAVFQVHLWSGVGLGLYILFISVTGSVLVYRNEMYVAATPVASRSTTPLVSDEPLIVEPTFGIRMVSTLIELHDDLLGGSTGRKVNGIGALAVVLVALTGLVIWWPGISRWRRSLTLRRGVAWKRFNWDLHSVIGIWSFAFIMVFAVSGVYLCFPQMFHSLADWIEPMTQANAGRRFLDGLLYWLAFLHFGRINGVGIPCDGPGLCDQSVKAIWAIFGLAPAAMFVTGVIMWWNRVLRPRRKRTLSNAAGRH
jgi:uncharacterized iron-regulated membrane protein